jgi:hypothetical protein
MIERAARKKKLLRNGFPLAFILAAACASVACGVAYFEIPIETPIQAKLDVTPFQRVLIAGFVSGGTDDVDANQETVRLLRSQLRTKSELKVIDADVMELAEIARDQMKTAPEAEGGDSGEPVPSQAQARPSLGTPAEEQRMALAPQIKDEKDIEPYERLFANTAYWKRIGEEYQNPLIVTGTVLFMPHSRAGYVTRDVEEYDSFGRRRVVPVRTYMERKGFILRPKFVFIDGRTGATMHQEGYREEILYSSQQNTPALSSYFELMDRLVPNFLNALSSQKVRGTRVLLK